MKQQKQARLLLIGLFLVATVAMNSYGLRDPFRTADGKQHCLFYGIGLMHGTNKRFALLLIDGIWHRVQERDTVAGYEVSTIAEEHCIVLKKGSGEEETIFRQKKPFNLDKLKG